MMQEPVVALVVAAGSGVRLGSPVPKALVDLAGSSLLRHSIAHLLAGGVSHLVVVVPEEHRTAFEDDLVSVTAPLVVVAGGLRRQDSVAAGLSALADWTLAQRHRVVLVHDAARPLVPAAVTAGVVAAVRAGATAVVPAVRVVDSIRQTDDLGSRPLDRSTLWAVQTPQGFDSEVLRRAHSALQASSHEVTDDAAACELIGESVTIVEGSSDSLKITTPIDLVLAASILTHDRERHGGQETR